VVLDTPCGPVAIAGHIKALGKPHDGPDVMENMLCLCPNHHEQFDKYAFYIEPENLSIVGLDGFEGKKLAFSNKHHIGKEFLEYQYQQYQRIN
jgi:putative restriction endonuclease